MTQQSTQPIIRLVTCGSVDDGKSTLIGRLLVETDSVPHDTVAAARNIRRSGSTIVAGEVDFSLLTDGLEAEREQGAPIEVAHVGGVDAHDVALNTNVQLVPGNARHVECQRVRFFVLRHSARFLAGCQLCLGQESLQRAPSGSKGLATQAGRGGSGKKHGLTPSTLRGFQHDRRLHPS